MSNNIPITSFHSDVFTVYVKQILTFYQFGNCKGVLLKYRSFIFHALNQRKAFKIIFWLKGVKTPQNYKRFTGVLVSRNPESFEIKIFKH